MKISLFFSKLVFIIYIYIPTDKLSYLPVTAHMKQTSRASSDIDILPLKKLTVMQLKLHPLNKRIHMWTCTLQVTIIDTALEICFPANEHSV